MLVVSKHTLHPCHDLSQFTKLFSLQLIRTILLPKVQCIFRFSPFTQLVDSLRTTWKLSERVRALTEHLSVLILRLIHTFCSSCSVDCIVAWHVTRSIHYDVIVCGRSWQSFTCNSIIFFLTLLNNIILGCHVTVFSLFILFIKATLGHNFETRCLFHPFNNLVIGWEFIFSTLAELPILRVLFALGNNHLFRCLAIKAFQTLTYLVVRRFAFLQAVAAITWTNALKMLLAYHMSILIDIVWFFKRRHHFPCGAVESTVWLLEVRGVLFLVQHMRHLFWTIWRCKVNFLWALCDIVFGRLGSADIRWVDLVVWLDESRAELDHAIWMSHLFVRLSSVLLLLIVVSRLMMHLLITCSYLIHIIASNSFTTSLLYGLENVPMVPSLGMDRSSWTQSFARLVMRCMQIRVIGRIFSAHCLTVTRFRTDFH